MSNNLNIIIAGGKTGGHLFPGIAVAQAVQELKPDAKILFVGTDAPFEIDTLARYGFEHKAILSRPVKGGNIFNKVWSLSLIFISLIQSMWIIRSFKPDFVLGVGGFSSFAVVLSAWLMRKPTAIQEQNAVPGLTNRMLSRFAATIFTSFEDTKGLKNNPKVRFVGNPVRKSDSSAETRALKGLVHFSEDRPTLLVTGGSQGAANINRAFVSALEQMADIEKFNIIHQTGKADAKHVLSQYREKAFKVNAGAFFENMPQLFKVADIVIARAGAGTLAELAEQGAACILIPYPHAADNHQEENAKALEKKGAALMITEDHLTGSTLKQAIDELIEDKPRREDLSEMLKSCAMPDADEKIAAHIIEASMGSNQKKTEA